MGIYSRMSLSLSTLKSIFVSWNKDYNTNLYTWQWLLKVVKVETQWNKISKVYLKQ